MSTVPIDRRTDTGRDRFERTQRPLLRQASLARTVSYTHPKKDISFTTRDSGTSSKHGCRQWLPNGLMTDYFRKFR